MPPPSPSSASTTPSAMACPSYPSSSLAPDPSSLPTLPHQSRRPPPSKRPAAGTLTPLVGIWATLILAWNTLIDVIGFIATAVYLKDTATPILASRGAENRPKRIVHRAVSLSDIKDIKNAMHCTVNDVLVGVTSAGLSRYLQRRYGQIVGNSSKKLQLSSSIRLRSTLLVNIRPIPGVHNLAELMEGKDGGTKWGNLLGYIILPFSTNEYKDPLDYIRMGQEIGKRKNSFEAIFTYKSANLIVRCVGLKAAAALSRRVLCNTTFSFSSMTGPVEEVAFYGHPIVYIAPSVYGHPQALTVHFQSYMNKMEIVLAADDEAIPDHHQFLDDFAESLQLIKGAIPSTL